MDVVDVASHLASAGWTPSRRPTLLDVFPSSSVWETHTQDDILVVAYVANEGHVWFSCGSFLLAVPHEAVSMSLSLLDSMGLVSMEHGRIKAKELMDRLMTKVRETKRGEA